MQPPAHHLRPARLSLEFVNAALRRFEVQPQRRYSPSSPVVSRAKGGKLGLQCGILRLQRDLRGALLCESFFERRGCAALALEVRARRSEVGTDVVQLEFAP